MLLAAVDRLTEHIGEADEYPEDAVAALLSDIHRDAPAMARADVLRLQQAMARLEEAVREQRARLDQNLGGMKRGQRAMRGYGYLRAARSGQRLRRKV
jgi:hypothetical protein